MVYCIVMSTAILSQDQCWASILTYWSARRQRQYFRPMIESTKYRNLSQKISKRFKPKHRPKSRHLVETVKTFWVRGEMNKFQDVCLRATRSRSGSFKVHLAPDILRPLPPRDPVTLVTPPHTDHCVCDYCMCIRLVSRTQ